MGKWKLVALGMAIAALIIGLSHYGTHYGAGLGPHAPGSSSVTEPAIAQPVKARPGNSSSSHALPRTAFVHLFEWTWPDVARECEAFLGPQGFAAVQVSPASEHVVLPEHKFPWWQRYQPVSYQLVSRSGDRAQFAAMVARCHAVGVDVYADAVINHMAGVAQGVGSAGTRFTKYSYPGLYDSSDFHPCRQNITNYGDRNDVTQCELVGLSDLDTAKPSVRDRLVDYLRDLSQLGVDGFRIDAAKHIRADDLGAIITQLNESVEPDPYIYQEVIDPGTEAIKKTEYYPNGDTIEFEYGRRVGAIFMGLEGQTLAQLGTLGETWGLAPSDKAIVFLDNHDKQRGHGGGGTYLTHKDGPLYDLATVFMLAYPYGYPQVMSSYAFDNSDQGPPADAQGRTQGVYATGQLRCFAEWICEHRRPAIAAMVRFRNATAADFRLTDWWSNGRNQIAFGRGDRGFVAINREATPLSNTFSTSLAPGRYCDILHSPLNQPCAAPLTVDSQGQFTATVASMEAIALLPDASGS